MEDLPGPGRPLVAQRTDWTTGWSVPIERVRDLVEAPERADHEEVAVLAAEHQVARFLLAELTEERDEAERHAGYLYDEQRTLRAAVDAAVGLLAALTDEDRDTLLLAIGARPEWLPDHPEDHGCDGCGPGVDDVPF